MRHRRGADPAVLRAMAARTRLANARLRAEAQPVLRELRGIASMDEISRALGTPWPPYRDSAGDIDWTDDPADVVMVLSIAAEKIGAVVKLRGLRPRRRDYFVEPGGVLVANPGIERTAVFAERLRAVYELLASRLRPRRRTLVWARGQVPSRYNQCALELAAKVVNLFPCWCSRPLTAADVKSRLQKRAR